MIHKFLFNDTTGKKSVTATAFIWGFLVVNLKLLISGMKFGDITSSNFGGAEYATALSALGAIYVLRRHPAFSGSKDENGNGKQS